MIQSKRLRDHAAQRKPDHMGASLAGRIQHIHHVAREIVQHQRRIDMTGTSVPAQIQPYHRESRGQRRRDLVPARSVGADSVDQHHRRAGALDLIE